MLYKAIKFWYCERSPLNNYNVLYLQFLELFGYKGRYQLVRCLQYMLQLEIDALINEFQAPKELDVSYNILIDIIKLIAIAYGLKDCVCCGRVL